MARSRTLFVYLATVAALAVAVAPASALAPAQGSTLAHAQLGPATNWHPDPGPHRGHVQPSSAPLPHRQPAASNRPLTTARPQAAPAAPAMYSAPTTPQRMIPGETYTVPFTVTNTTANTLAAAEFDLSYHWTLPDGTDRTTIINRLDTSLPSDLAAGKSVDLDAAVKAPSLDPFRAVRQAFVLKWDLRDRKTGKFLSETAGIPTLDQNVAVEDPTSDQLGLERFYSYSGIASGAGTSAVVNGANGNLVFGYAPLSDPGRGLASFVRLIYNSQDTSNSFVGPGWSLSASSLPRLGTPLQFDPLGGLFGYPHTVTLVDGDGTSHVFALDRHGSDDPKDWDYDKPAGVHLYLQHTGSDDPNRAWVMTQPDRTQFFFDTDGFQTATVDRNGNTMTFNYVRSELGNRNTGVLTSVTDPAGRQALSFNYFQPGQPAPFFTGRTRRTTPALNNNLIAHQLQSITDLSGRRITFTYNDQGLLTQLADGAGTAQEKDFDFFYQDSALVNPKLTVVNDPLGHGTSIGYYADPADWFRFGRVRSLTDRLGGVWQFDYARTDPKSGTPVRETITDPNGHASAVLLDGYGRLVSTTDAKSNTTSVSYDADNNVIRLQEPNKAISSWVYDQNTGYPLQITDAQNAAHGGASIGASYQTYLNGHVADIISNVSAEGRKSTFAYDASGNLTSATEPNGNVSGTPAGHFTTKYTYDVLGQLLTSTDPKGNVTTYGDYDPNGFPRTSTNALGDVTHTAYDSVGNVVSITDANGKASTYAYDIFKRPMGSRVPIDQAAGRFVVTPLPVYDANDNIVRQTAPNGAVSTATYDADDRVVASNLPDAANKPTRLATFTYDRAGNELTSTEPNGHAPGAAVGSFTTTNTYDEIDQLVASRDPNGGTTRYTYDNVGNNTSIVDPLGHTTARYAYDLDNRTTTVTDADGNTKSATYDLDGRRTGSTDEQGNHTVDTLDANGQTVEVRMPFKKDNGAVVDDTTRYIYDENGNQTETISPRAVAAGRTDAFVSQTRYDRLNRVSAQLTPFDPKDSRYNKPNETDYNYDAVSQLTKVSAPPSGSQKVRNDTTYTHFDNGWTRTSTDPWGITASYDYNELGQQTARTLAGVGGAAPRTMAWAYNPDGTVLTRTDNGVPAGSETEVVDNSDAQHVSAVGGWPQSSAGTGFQGFDYQTHAPGPGNDSFTWQLVVPTDGTYDVFVQYPHVDGAAKDAAYQIDHSGHSDKVTVDQTQRAGEWVQLGSYAFTADGPHQQITLAANANGTVAADAVKIVRHSNGPPPPQQEKFTYHYDADGNLVDLKDQSVGAKFNDYTATFDTMDRLAKLEVKSGGTVAHSTSFGYDADGNTINRADDAAKANFSYDPRNLLVNVINAESATDKNPKVTKFGYTPSGEVDRETRPNGNVVTSSYFLNGLLQHQIENKSDGTVVAEHTLNYDPNGNKIQDVAKTQNADNHANYLNRTTDNTYDPLDRLASSTKSGGGGDETYVHDADSNVTSQTVGGQTTTSTYDRNRLQSSAAGGFTTSYNYDPYGRLDNVSLNGSTVESFTYDGFDHIATNRKKSGSTFNTTSYGYDPFDRTVSQTTGSKTTTFDYLGMSNALAAEHENGKLTKTYQYSPWGQRLSQVVHKDGGSEEPTYYSYDSHSNVQDVTDSHGDTKATYGYTAYGADDPSQDTGVDKPGSSSGQGQNPYNSYRFNAARIDANSSTYNMGFRTYDPGLNSFLTRDGYNGALSDLGLAADPFTGNRYAFGGGNPLSNIELTGHNWLSDLGHAALDVVGMIPVVGSVADVANAGWYALDGDYLDAGLSLAGAIPGIGDAALGAKYAIKGAKYADEAVEGIEAARTLAKGAKDVGEVGEAAQGVKTAEKAANDVDETAQQAAAAQKAQAAQAEAAQKAEAARVAAAREAAAERAAAAREAKAEESAEANAEGRAESEAEGSGCATNSFPAQTTVLLGDGTTKAISDVTVGDRVEATDPSTGATVSEPVTAQIITPDDEDFAATTVRTADGETSSVVSTQHHPFWDATTKIWVDAVDLTPGDQLREPNGTLVSIVSVRSYHTNVTTYNLTVADLHTYYVAAGTTFLLVHNVDEKRLCDLTLGAGPYAKEGVALPGGNARAEGVQELINESGAAHGCHTCGVRDPGTKSGNWITDHQGATKLVSDAPFDVYQTGYPHCLQCARQQGGIVTQIVRGSYEFGIEP